MLQLHEEPRRKDKGQWEQVASGDVSSQYKKKNFTVRTIKHWNYIPRDVQSPYCWRLSRCNWTGC